MLLISRLTSKHREWNTEDMLLDLVDHLNYSYTSIAVASHWEVSSVQLLSSNTNTQNPGPAPDCPHSLFGGY
jgi:hypothetical protein